MLPLSINQLREKQVYDIELAIIQLTITLFWLKVQRFADFNKTEKFNAFIFNAFFDIMQKASKKINASISINF